MNDSFLKQAREGNKTAILKKEIIGCFIDEGDFTIPDLSREINLSVPTVTKLIGELIEEGFVYDLGKQGTNGGRRPNLYGLNPDAGYFAGIDVKTDCIAIGLMNFKGQVTNYELLRDFELENSRESLDRLCEHINTFLDKQAVPRDRIIAAGVNLSGRVNSGSGYSYSFYYVDEKPLSEQIEDKIGCCVYLENDTRAMTYGEYTCGAVKSERNIIFVNVSWGLGTGIIVDGKLYYGKSGFSGEFGHFPYFDNEILCRCGKRGCLETGASGSAVHRMFMERLREGNASMLADKFNAGVNITLDDIIGAVCDEDVLAIEIIESVAVELGKAIAGLINLFNPELIVIGGSLAATRDYLLLPLKSAVNKHSLTLVNKDTDIRISRLGEKTGVIGACMLVRSKTLGLL